MTRRVSRRIASSRFDQRVRRQARRRTRRRSSRRGTRGSAGRSRARPRSCRRVGRRSETGTGGRSPSCSRRASSSAIATCADTLSISGVSRAQTGIERAQPAEELGVLRGRHGARERLEEVVMRVDEPRQHDHAAAVDHLVGRRGQRGRRSDGLDDVRRGQTPPSAISRPPSSIVATTVASRSRSVAAVVPPLCLSQALSGSSPAPAGAIMVHPLRPRLADSRTLRPPHLPAPAPVRSAQAGRERPLTPAPALAPSSSAVRAQRAAFARERYPNRYAAPDRLARLKSIVADNEARFVAAIDADFGHRSAHETRLAELYIVASGHPARAAARRPLDEAGARRHATAPAPARARIERQPLGVVGIISPWNYPVQLALAPASGRARRRQPRAAEAVGAHTRDVGAVARARRRGASPKMNSPSYWATRQSGRLSASCPLITSSSPGRRRSAARWRLPPRRTSRR